MDTRVFNPSVIFSVMPDLLSYLSVTLLVAVSSIVLGSLLGMGLTWANSDASGFCAGWRTGTLTS